MWHSAPGNNYCITKVVFFFTDHESTTVQHDSSVAVDDSVAVLHFDGSSSQDEEGIYVLCTYF